MKAIGHAVYQQSLWEATGGAAPAVPPLQASLDCDVAIVGAGITGLSTALHLAEKGVSVCVLDAAEPAWGASGRNGGQVIPGIKHDPKAIFARYGHEHGAYLLDMVGSAADTVFELIDRYRIDCSPVRKGWIQPAHTARALALVQDRAMQWAERGAPVILLDRAQVRDRLGTHHYLGGWLDLRAGSVHPLRYTRGLLAVAQSKGVQVFGKSEAVSLRRVGDRWVVSVPNGSQLRAPRALIATNAYTGDLWPQLKRSVIAANSFIIATEPLEPNVDASILPGGEVASDSRRLLLYFRRDHEGRFILGGRGIFKEPRSADDWRHLVRAAYRLYPQLQGISFPYRWSGRVALTRDFIPHVHEPAPGLSIVLGYNGRGVALGTQMGKYLAQNFTDGTRFPFRSSRVSPIPMHGMRRLFIALGIMYYGLCDRLT